MFHTKHTQKFTETHQKSPIGSRKNHVYFRKFFFYAVKILLLQLRYTGVNWEFFFTVHLSKHVGKKTLSTFLKKCDFLQK